MDINFKALSDEDLQFLVWDKFDFGNAIRMAYSLKKENFQKFDENKPPKAFEDLAEARLDTFAMARAIPTAEFGEGKEGAAVREKLKDIISIIQFKSPVGSIDDLSGLLIGVKMVYDKTKQVPTMKKFLVSFVENVLPIKVKALDISLRVMGSELAANGFLYTTIIGNLNILHDIQDARVLAFTIHSIGLLIGAEAAELFKSYANIKHGIAESELSAIKEGDDLLKYVDNLSIPAEMSQKLTEVLSSDLKDLKTDTALNSLRKDDLSPREFNKQIVLGSNFDMSKVSDIQKILYNADDISDDTVHEYFGNDMNPEYQLSPEMLAYLKVSKTPLLSIVGKDNKSVRHIMPDFNGTSFLVFRDPMNVSTIYGVSLDEEDNHKRKVLRTLIPKDKEVALEMGDLLDEIDIGEA